MTSGNVWPQEKFSNTHLLSKPFLLLWLLLVCVLVVSSLLSYLFTFLPLSSSSCIEPVLWLKLLLSLPVFPLANPNTGMPLNTLPHSFLISQLLSFPPETSTSVHLVSWPCVYMPVPLPFKARSLNSFQITKQQLLPILIHSAPWSHLTLRDSPTYSPSLGAWIALPPLVSAELLSLSQSLFPTAFSCSFRDCRLVTTFQTQTDLLIGVLFRNNRVLDPITAVKKRNPSFSIGCCYVNQSRLVLDAARKISAPTWTPLIFCLFMTMAWLSSFLRFLNSTDLYILSSQLLNKLASLRTPLHKALPQRHIDNLFIQISDTRAWAKTLLIHPALVHQERVMKMTMSRPPPLFFLSNRQKSGGMAMSVLFCEAPTFWFNSSFVRIHSNLVPRSKETYFSRFLTSLPLKHTVRVTRREVY